MSSIHSPDPRLHRSGAATFLAIFGCAVMLAGCVSDYEAIMEETPKDYRQRHPIAIQEGVHTVELFIGSKRGELTLDQRADVIAFAQTWRRQATGGVLIDIPSGTGTADAAADALREIARSSLVPGAAASHRCAPLAAGGRGLACDRAAELADNGGPRRALRAVAARSRRDLRSRAQREHRLLESRLCDPAQHRRHGGKSR
jgi:hypothetical protein